MREPQQAGSTAVPNRPGTQAADRPPSTAQISGQEITNLLSRSGYGPGGSDVRVLWATREYFRFTAQQATASQYDPENNLVFFVWENIHDGDLTESFRPVLRVDGGVTYEPARVIVPADAVHHRFSVFIYPREDPHGAPIVGTQTRSLELILPPATADGARSILSWVLPVEYPSALRVATTHLTWASLLALLGGLLASMWPCLFQLTAYFIPSLAGISMDQARRPDQAATARAHVMKAAAFFVLGFVIVYTAAGAAAGFAAQSLSGTTLFWSLRRPLSIAAGLVILVMALRVAINARAPLVCRMPGAVKLGRWSGGHLGTMLLGLSFAIGCTTCFGAAVVLGIVAYAGMTGTPLFGALIMFLFALGMAIPLLAGAAAMARVLSLLGRLERVAPWMALGSSIVMAGFAVMLLSGRFMVLSNWFISRTTGL
ncbi:MAG: cytochrome c biogenesis protein CcdA [Armatimonadetes bacterium]|nr:cytochrome c biogenesis protein CcdA [Armatimonadota bacterium]